MTKVLIFVACLLVVLAIAIRTWTWTKQRPVFRANHPVLLAACRELIDKRQTYRNERVDAQTNPGDPVFPPKTEIPSAIMDLKPKYVTITKDYAMICFSALPRVYILGFPQGAKEYGTKKLIDGLWYSNDPARDRREAMRVSK